MLLDIHHIQLAMPEGSEAQARNFYAGVLSLDEIEKPESLRSRGGVWFTSNGVEVHLGVEKQFSPAKKAHPAFRVASLDEAITTLSRHGVNFRRDIDLPGLRRVYVDDPFGNRIEILETRPTE